MRIRIGYIGTGMMGLQHVEIFRDHFSERAEGVALCDPHKPNRLKAILALPEAQVYHDADELIRSDLDAVVISTPNNRARFADHRRT